MKRLRDLFVEYEAYSVKMAEVVEGRNPKNLQTNSLVLHSRNIGAMPKIEKEVKTRGEKSSEKSSDSQQVL